MNFKLPFVCEYEERRKWNNAIEYFWINFVDLFSVNSAQVKLSECNKINSFVHLGWFHVNTLLQKERGGGGSEERRKNNTLHTPFLAIEWYSSVIHFFSLRLFSSNA